MWKQIKEMKRSKLVFFIVTFILLCLLIYVGGTIIRWCIDGSRIREMSSNYSVDTDSNVIIDINQSSDSNEIGGTNNYDYLQIDLNKYYKDNYETVGFLHIPAIELSMPIVQHYDNNYYLNHDFSGKDAKTGWAFLDYKVDNVGEYIPNTVIYGHSRRDGLMFGGLSLIDDNKLKEDKNKYIYYQTFSYTMVYEIFAVYVTKPSYPYIRTTFNEGELGDFIKTMSSNNTISELKQLTDEDINSTEGVLTLSTCSGDNRRVIQARLVSKKPIMILE